MIYEDLYKGLHELGIVDAINNGITYAKSQSAGYMDLVFEVVTLGTMQSPEGEVYHYTDIYLAHYWELNGDLMSDPLMMVRVWEYEMAEALSFRQDGLPLPITYSYQTIDGERYVNKKAKKANNDFLLIWLRNLKNQGHTLKGVRQIVV